MQYAVIHKIIHTQKNLSTVKWAQWDKTQSRELLGLFLCMCTALCTTVAHNIAQNRPDNFPSYPPITIAPMMSIWGKGGARSLETVLSKSTWLPITIPQQLCPCLILFLTYTLSQKMPHLLLAISWHARFDYDNCWHKCYRESGQPKFTLFFQLT